MINFESSGDFKNMESFLHDMQTKNWRALLAQYGQKGVNALASATPKESGLTAASWTYEIVESKGSVSIIWSNTNTRNGIPVAILLQYGHGTGTGGYVRGLDYINPAIKPIFDEISNQIGKAVSA